MALIEVKNLSKSYGVVKAVDDLNFVVEAGEIFGFIGQNGAGKTTTIRIMMNIIESDRGEVSVFSRKMNGGLKDRIGYLPEERGLYTKASVMQAIRYFAALKGMDKKSAGDRAEALLTRMNLFEHRNRKLGQLSKGMSQLVQFIVAIVHDPEILILDEPFSGLDPSNADAIKGMVRQLKAEGKTVFFSAHNMHDIEELCDRVLMIKNGRRVLYGSLAEIQEAYRVRNRYWLKAKGDLRPLSAFAAMEESAIGQILQLHDGVEAKDVLNWLLRKDIEVEGFVQVLPNLNEIFLEIAGEKNEKNAGDL